MKKNKRIHVSIEKYIDSKEVKKLPILYQEMTISFSKKVFKMGYSEKVQGDCIVTPFYKPISRIIDY